LRPPLYRIAIRAIIMTSAPDAEHPERVKSNKPTENGIVKQPFQEHTKEHQKESADFERSKSVSAVEAEDTLLPQDLPATEPEMLSKVKQESTEILEEHAAPKSDDAIVDGEAEDKLLSQDIPNTEPEVLSKVNQESTEILDDLAAPKIDDAIVDGMKLEDSPKREDSSEGMIMGDGKEDAVESETHSVGKEKERTDENRVERETVNNIGINKSPSEGKTHEESGIGMSGKVDDSRLENGDDAKDPKWNSKENQVSVQELCAFYEASATPPIKSSTTSLASLDENKEDEIEKLEDMETEQNKSSCIKQNEGNQSIATTVDIPVPKTEIVADQMKEDQDFATQTLIMDLQTAVQEHLNGREDAIERAKKSEGRVKHLEESLKSKKALETELKETKVLLESVSSDREHLLAELEKLRTNRDDHERKQIVLSNRLNDAKKKEAVKANLAEKLEDEIRVLKHELESVRVKLGKTEAVKKKLFEENSSIKGKYEQQLKKLESNVSEEKRLNDERKKKMKAFVENKQEELRDARSQNDELNLELSQTNRSLREHHSRWKQLHAQWVQSQTRNRELQRDINRMKKESENMSRLGDRMNEKLSQSAQETEEHKNKRMNAKQELMSLLATLETEREVSSKLQDSIKFTFTPKALSQQQILKESLRDFEQELENLSQRLGKTLPHMNATPVEMLDDEEEEEDKGGNGNRRSRSEIDSVHLLGNLEDETQRVSKCIMAMASKIERLHMLISQRGDRSCATVLTDILSGVAIASEETTSMTGSNYGHVPTVNH